MVVGYEEDRAPLLVEQNDIECVDIIILDLSSPPVVGWIP